MKLYFVRHGKTEWNLEGRFQGASGDSPLLQSSLEHLELLAEHLSTVPFDKIYTSDLPRAYKTAKIIAKYNSCKEDIELSENLREWRLGRLEGAKIATMQAIYPQQIDAFRNNLAKFNPDVFDAESVNQTTNRVIEFVRNLKNTNYENVLIVGHGANLTASIRRLLGYDMPLLRKDGGLSNASITLLETKDFQHFDLLAWNDLSYVDELALAE
ncbi:Phosphoglycerate mutase family 5 [Streptococcus sp. DD10]|uniref:histidine phosphatase family protein n=1 Tax=Streptococcus sp. DD10 TaxID=1777878 RepID=UPI000795101E|nr:histidine phosphatase family protein [Streptococcus sp. DD10]KXT73429.1 Phosphoglycerate mutase family 5 [Streptococcus sp. DD10]